MEIPYPEKLSSNPGSLTSWEKGLKVAIYSIGMAMGSSSNVSENPKKRQKSLPKAAQAIMKEYPVKPIKE